MTTKSINSLLLACLLMLLSVACQRNRQVAVSQTAEDLILTIGDKPVLKYHIATQHPPKGVDSIYGKSGFIHPLRTLNSKVLTRIQPADHYHHYGLWNAWTKVAFAGDTLDFWNLKKGEGTVRFAGVESIDPKGFSVHQEHVVRKNGTEEIALRERLQLNVAEVQTDYYSLDVKLTFSCATSTPFHILAYRYAGFCWRTTEDWHKGNSEVLASEGQTRLDANASRAKWFLVQGELGEDYGGMIVMSHPDNINHPEPMRIWPVEADKRGDIMAMFAPTQQNDWLLEPKQEYTLSYRLVVFDEKMTPEKADHLWQAFSKKG